MALFYIWKTLRMGFSFHSVVARLKACITSLTRSIYVSAAIWKSNSSSWGATLPYTVDGVAAVRSENLLCPLQVHCERLLQILFPSGPQLPPAGTLASASP